MFSLDTWQEIYHTLAKNKLRTFLTAFGVIWGIFMLIVMLGAGNGMINGTSREFGDFATNSVFIWPQTTTIPYKGFQRGRFFWFDDNDTKSILQNIPEIDIMAPRIDSKWVGGDNRVVKNEKSGVYNILGDYPGYIKIDPLNIVKGRFLNQTDLDEKRKVAIIGKTPYDQLYKKDENPVGTYIKVNGIFMQVIGQFESKHSGGWAEYQNQWIIIPFTTMQNTFNMGGKVGHFSITAKEGYSATNVEKKVRKILARNHYVAPEDELAFGSQNVEKEFIKMKGLMTGLNALIWIVGFMTLLAGVIGVSNIMLIIVKERTKEIGIKRAIGASPYRIISQIIFESTALTAFAGYMGLMLGISVLEIMRFALSKSPEPNSTFVDPGVSFSTVILSLLIRLFLKSG